MSALFTPSLYTSSPARLTEEDVHAVIVRCDYRPVINTPKVKNGQGIHLYFGVVEEGARGIVLEKTFYFKGTQNDDASRNVLASVLRTVGHADDLTEENLADWCDSIATTSGPLKIVTQEDPKNAKYRRIRFLNSPTAYSDAREVFAEQISAMADLAEQSSTRLALATGGTEDVAL